MSKETEVKTKYNKATYRRYEFNVNVDSELNHSLEEYKKDNNLSELIKELLYQHFDGNTPEPEEDEEDPTKNYALKPAETIQEYFDRNWFESVTEYKILQHLKKTFSAQAYENMDLTFHESNDTMECYDGTKTIILGLRGNLIHQIDKDFEEPGDSDSFRGIV